MVKSGEKYVSRRSIILINFIKWPSSETIFGARAHSVLLELATFNSGFRQSLLGVLELGFQWGPRLFQLGNLDETTPFHFLR